MGGGKICQGKGVVDGAGYEELMRLEVEWRSCEAANRGYDAAIFGVH